MKKVLLIFVILLIIGLAVGGLMLTKKSEPVNSDQIALRIGYTKIELGPDISLKVKAAVEENNQKARLEGLEDGLNPEILDFAKVEAFLQGLSKLPEEVLDQLRGKVLYLGAPTLDLGVATAVTVENLKQGYSLTVPQVAQGEIVQPTLKVAIDKSRAQDLVEQARKATAFFNQEVERLEATVDKNSSSDLRELSLAKWQRFAVSMVWRDNSLALTEAEPVNELFKADAEKAKEAAAKYVFSSWIGMPGSAE